MYEIFHSNADVGPFSTAERWASGPDGPGVTAALLLIQVQSCTVKIIARNAVPKGVTVH